MVRAEGPPYLMIQEEMKALAQQKFEAEMSLRG
jgi:hypothetical protein